MLRERARMIALGFLVADLALVAIAFFLAYWVRGRLMPDLDLAGPLYPLADYLPLLPLFLLIWAVLLLSTSRYRSNRTASLMGEAWDIVKLGVAATLLFTLSIYLFRFDALLLTSRTGSALYVATVDAPRVIQRPAASGTTVRWRAAAHRDGGLYRLYAAPEGEEVRLVSEQEAKVGMTDYSVSVPQAEGETSLYELRYVSPNGEETMLQSLLVHDLISRMLILFSGIIATFLLLAQTLAIRGLAHFIRRRGYNYRQVVIIGTGPSALEIADTIATHRYWGLRVLGFVDVGESSLPGVGPILGTQDELPRLAEELVIDQVIFAAGRQRFDDLEDVVLDLEERGIATCFALNLFPNTNAKAQLAEMGGTPVVTFSTGPTNQLQLFLKRLTDVVVSAAALVVLSPLIVLIALAVKVSSPGPVLFRQERCGLNGRRFILLKFRTMVVDAERQLEKLRRLNEMQGPVFKLTQDPRVTPAGRLLRKFSLDELPQLWNVLKGDMSLVGPRPPVPEEVDQYERWQRRRLSMRPGLTCLWQVSGRNKVDFERWMELDLEYIDSWSPRLDMKILLKTIPAVLSGRGAS